MKESLINNTGSLRVSLGRWIQSTEGMYKDRWKWWLNHENILLYRYRDNVWEMFSPLTQRRRRRNSHRVYIQYIVAETVSQEIQLRRTSAKYQNGLYIFLGYHTKMNIHDQKQAQPASDRRFKTYSDEEILLKIIHALDIREEEQWALKDILTNESITEIVRNIGNGTSVAVSDGSYKDNGGTAAWIIENECGSQRMVRHVNVPGTVSDQSAYRSEIAAIYGLVLVIEANKT